MEPETQVPRRRGRRAYLVLGGLALLAVVGYFVHGWWVRDKVSTDNAQVEADVVPIAARVGGTVRAVPIGDNAQVKKGDLLVEIDPRDLEVKLRQEEADLEAAKAEADAADAQVAIVEASSTGGLSSAKAQLTGSSASVRTAAAQVEAASAAVARARSQLVRASADVERARALMAQSAIPRRELDVAEAAFAAAQADVASAQAGLEAAREQRRVAETRVSEAEGRVEQTGPVEHLVTAATARARLAHARVAAAEAAREQAQLQLSYTKVTAPEDGIASRLAVHPGQSVQPGQALVALVPRAVYVIANLKETEVARIHAGEAVDIELDAFPRHTFHGRVDSISGGTGARFALLPPDNSTGNFVKVVQRVPVKIVLDALPKGVELRAGLSAEVTVHLD